MRVLVATTAGLGHFGPLVPFAAACRRAGHEVVVAAPESFAAEVGRAGFDHRPFSDAPPDMWGAIIARLPHLTYEEAQRVVLGEVFAGADVRAALPGVLATIEEWRPDLVLRESAELASHLAAQRLGVPEARVAVGLAAVEHRADAVYAEALAPVRAELGLDDDGLGAPPWFSMTPATFEDPGFAGPPGARRYRRDEEPAAQPLPDWWPGAMGDLPLVYLTFGTVAATIPTFAAALVTAVGAVATLPVRVLLTLGQGADPAAFAELPENVHVERWIPQAGVLPHASAVVCHGGYGSVQGALAAGVPLVVSPQFADQPYNAERVAALGAGVALPLGPPEPKALEEAVETVLAERTCRSAAAALAEEIRALPPAAEAVDRFVENARHD